MHKGLTLLAARIRCDSSERVERDFAGAVNAARRVRGGDERGHGPGLCQRCCQQIRVSNLFFANSLPRVRIYWARSMRVHERVSSSYGQQHGLPPDFRGRRRRWTEFFREAPGGSQSRPESLAVARDTARRCAISNASVTSAFVLVQLHLGSGKESLACRHRQQGKGAELSSSMVRALDPTPVACRQQVPVKGSVAEGKARELARIVVVVSGAPAQRSASASRCRLVEWEGQEPNHGGSGAFAFLFLGRASDRITASSRPWSASAS